MASMTSGSVTGVPTVAVPRAVFDPALVGRRRPPGPVEQSSIADGRVAVIPELVPPTLSRDSSSSTGYPQPGSLPARLPYRPELDGIRAVAVLLVLAFHARIPFVTGNGGTFGVTLFFVLSGYLITTILIGERASSGRIGLRAFYGRRARRLLPALVAVVLVTGAVAAALGAITTYLPTAAVSLFYVANYATPLFDAMPLIGHTWSLSVEEQFYLLWPLALIVAGRRALVLGVAGIVVVNAIRLLVPMTDDTMFQSQFRADAVLWGCVLALVSVRLPRALSIAWLLVPVIAVTDVQLVGALPVMALVSVAIVASAGALPFLRWRWLVRIGTISYGLYLWHYPVAVLLRDPGSPFAMLAVFVVSFALALASERWIERPFRSRGAVAHDRRVPDVVVGERALEPHREQPVVVIEHPARVDGVAGT
jgi:peptidoglycan/LPS O-acetylase OafA/YrhL